MKRRTSAKRGWQRFYSLWGGASIAAGDVNGDGAADCAVRIISAATPAKEWFLL